MKGKKLLGLVMVLVVTLLISGFSGCKSKKDAKSECNSPCKREDSYGGMTYRAFCDGGFECNMECEKCRNPDCLDEDDCICPQEVVQNDPVAGRIFLITLGGGVYIDQNDDGKKNEGELVVGGAGVAVVDKNCVEDCDPVATTKTDQEGVYSIEIQLIEGITYILEVDVKDWPSKDKYFTDEYGFKYEIDLDILEDPESPDSKIEKDIGLVTPRSEFPDWLNEVGEQVWIPLVTLKEIHNSMLRDAINDQYLVDMDPIPVTDIEAFGGGRLLLTEEQVNKMMDRINCDQDNTLCPTDGPGDDKLDWNLPPQLYLMKLHGRFSKSTEDPLLEDTMLVHGISFNLGGPVIPAEEPGTYNHFSGSNAWFEFYMKPTDGTKYPPHLSVLEQGEQVFIDNSGAFIWVGENWLAFLIFNEMFQEVTEYRVFAESFKIAGETHEYSGDTFERAWEPLVDY